MANSNNSTKNKSRSKSKSKQKPLSPALLPDCFESLTEADIMANFNNKNKHESSSSFLPSNSFEYSTKAHSKSMSSSSVAAGEESGDERLTSLKEEIKAMIDKRIIAGDPDFALVSRARNMVLCRISC